MFQVLGVVFALSLLVNFATDFLRKGMVNWQWREKKFWALALFVAIQFVLVQANDPRGMGGGFYLMAFFTGPVLFFYSVVHALMNLPQLMFASRHS